MALARGSVALYDTYNPFTAMIRGLVEIFYIYNSSSLPQGGPGHNPIPRAFAASRAEQESWKLKRLDLRLDQV